MRRFRVLLIGLLAVGLVTAVSGTAGASPRAAKVDTVEADTLTVATNLPAPGFWNGDNPDSVNGGFEYAMAKEIAKRLKLKDGVKVQNVSFDSLVAGQASGFDLAFSQVTIKPERAEVVDFSVPYFSSDQGILMLKDSKKKKIKSFKDAAKLQWGIQGSTTAQDFLDARIKPKKKPRVYQETTGAFTALQGGDVDAVLLDTAIVLEQANQKGSGMTVVAQFKTGENYGAVFEKGSKLRAPVDKIIKAMKKDGTLAKLGDKYLKPAFGKDPQKVPYVTK